MRASLVRNPCIELDEHLVDVCWNFWLHFGLNSLVNVWSKTPKRYFLNAFFFFVQNDSEVTVVWASLASSDADSTLSKHTMTGILSGKHNLIKKAMSAMQPEGTTPTSTKSAAVIGPYFSSYIMLSCLSMYLFLSF